MTDLNSRESYCELIRAMQCTASARAVASLAAEQVTADGDLAQASLAVDLIGAIEICLQAAVEAHARLGV
ncbi:MAG: hypothetical protein ACK4KV_09515 [Rhodocyclaceae bacterium]